MLWPGWHVLLLMEAIPLHLSFIWLLTKSNRINCEMFQCLVAANSAKCFSADSQWPEPHCKSKPELFKAKNSTQLYYLLCSGNVSQLTWIWHDHAFHLLMTKLKGKFPKEQATNEVDSCLIYGADCMWRLKTISRHFCPALTFKAWLGLITKPHVFDISSSKLVNWHGSLDWNACCHHWTITLCVAAKMDGQLKKTLKCPSTCMWVLLIACPNKPCDQLPTSPGCTLTHAQSQLR